MTETVAAPVDDADLLAEVTAWLDEHWDPDLTVAQWWGLVGRSGWTAPHFPREWGGLGYSRRSVVAVRAAFQRHGAVQPPGGMGLLMAAPTILSHGTEEQIERHVTRDLRRLGGVVPVLQRAGVGLRPRRPFHPRDA